MRAVAHLVPIPPKAVTRIPVRRWLVRQRNVLRASDPGLGRLRQASAGAGSMASALAVGYGYARLIDADQMVQLISMLLAAIVSMIGSMALTGPEVLSKLRTAVGFPVAIGAGMAGGTLLADRTALLLWVFVLVVFIAVYIRRFGLPFFFYGFMLWIGYFFSSFLQPPASMLPELIGAAAVGAAWVALLSVTIFRTNPARTLANVRRTFGARALELVGACATLLASNSPRRTKRAAERIHGRHIRVQETALMIEAWSGDETALPAGWTAAGLRRRTLEWTLALDRLTAAAGQLVNAPAAVRTAAETALRSLSDGNDSAARDHADRLRRQANACETADDALLTTGRMRVLALRVADSVDEIVTLLTTTEPLVAAIDEHGADTGDFTPAVGLFLGNLPGSPSVARDVPPRTGRWNPLGRLSFTTRQAVQVAVACALAIWIGRELDATRYYWAVIAAFIGFTGTGSRSETFLKSANRVFGTLAGLVAGIWIAHRTVGNTPLMVAVIVVSIFCGLYLVRVNYSYMIFFITIMVSQLYGILHEFSDHLLMLRLEETVIGAACGIAVALIVAPLSTRDTVEHAQATLLTTLADLLETVAAAVDGGPVGAPEEGIEDGARDAAGAENRSDSEERRDSDDKDGDDEDDEGPSTSAELLVALEDGMRKLQLVAKPLTRPLLWDNSPRVTRHRLTVYGAVVRMARAATVALPPTGAPQAAALYRQVAAAARIAARDPAPLGAGRHTPDGDLARAVAEAETQLEDLAASGLWEHSRLIPAARLTELIPATGSDGPLHPASATPEGARSVRGAPAR